VLLRLPYLALSSVFALVRLLPMSGTDKDIEILALRHQLAVLQRHIDRPRITSTDRVFLAALLHRLPRVLCRSKIGFCVVSCVFLEFRRLVCTR
jgi:putative transposase